MSNIYDSANELSRGLRELPEYKAVKAAKDAIQYRCWGKQNLYRYVAFQEEIQGLAQTGQMPDASFQAKMENDLASRFKGIASYQNSLPSNNNWPFTFLILKNCFRTSFRIAKIRK